MQARAELLVRYASEVRAVPFDTDAIFDDIDTPEQLIEAPATMNDEVAGLRQQFPLLAGPGPQFPAGATADGAGRCGLSACARRWRATAAVRAAIPLADRSVRAPRTPHRTGSGARLPGRDRRRNDRGSSLPCCCLGGSS